MKLNELEPRWFVLENGGPRVGLTFECPHCRQQRLGIAFHVAGHEAIDDAYIRAHYGGDKKKFIWTLNSEEDFDSLTLTRSIDASESGHWHGNIVNGNMTNA